MLFCALLLTAAACEKDATPPETMLVGSADAQPEKDAAPLGSSSSSSASPPVPVKPSSCVPKDGEVCLIGAEFEHAAVLLHHVTGGNVVVVGSYDKRIDGVISTVSPSSAFAALAKQAGLEHLEIAGIHFLGDAASLARGRGRGVVNFCREPKTIVAQRTDPQELSERIVEDAGRNLQGTIEGEVTVAGSQIDACAVVQYLAIMAGGQLRVDAKAVRVTGDAALPKSPRAAGRPCAPLDTDKVLRQSCHKNADLAVVGVGRVNKTDAAIVRRTGRTFEPVSLVVPGEHVGDYHQEVGAIDATGLKSKKNSTIVFWSP